jgi:hypothetical protein
MVDWTKNFRAEYEYLRPFIADERAFAEEWRPLIRRLQKLCTDTGFDPSNASALSDLRKAVTWGERKLLGHKTASEDEGILRAVEDWSDGRGGPPDGVKLMRAAMLKLLRHVYLINKYGNRKAWVVDLPTAFGEWPSDEIHRLRNSRGAVGTLLRSDREVFSLEKRKHLGEATGHAMSWCQRTLIVLALAAKAANGKAGTKEVDALNLVKRWFADPGTSLPDLQQYIDRLSRGFKGIIKLLNKGQVILADFVPLRRGTTQDEIDFLESEAFVFSNHGEGLDVIYIERSFFVDHPGNVLKGLKNWIRILVHELSHLECGTTDVQIGQARYAWYGIGPHAGYPGSECIRNADNWAFFAADCAGQLTNAERTTALKIV